MIKTVSMDELSPLIEELIESGTDIILTVTGNSMFPILRDRRDRVVLTHAGEKLKKFDIPLYRRDGGQYILHRIVKVKGDHYYINGDNQTFIEKPVYRRQIKAVVREIQRGGMIMPVKHPLYVIYSRVWVWFFPFRKLMLKVYLNTVNKLIKLLNH